MNRSQGAFTLLELMIAITIIGILAASIFPFLAQYQERARDSERRWNAETLGLAIQNYMLENQTWRSIGGGEGNTGSGYADYTPSGWKAIATILEEAGFLEKNTIPTVTDKTKARYMIYGCNDMTFSVGVHLTFPSKDDLIQVFTACNGLDGMNNTSGNGMYNKYGMNSAVNRWNFCIAMPKSEWKLYNCEGKDIFSLTGATQGPWWQ